MARLSSAPQHLSSGSFLCYIAQIEVFAAVAMFEDKT